MVNSLGQLVVSKEVTMVNGENSFEISTADLANGVYLLDITTSNGKTTKKLVVNH
ncbi:MAG: T9SS type A sorting domain-containing protein [Bacteroidetes bacterium]|nr:T9SS type A sorting domain-containing protein [Bacteroidota bacterium]